MIRIPAMAVALTRFVDSEKLPPSPQYVFRGQVAEITCLQFISDDQSVVSGDAEGWVVVWRMSTRRPTAVWRAHEASVLSIHQWGERIITYGCVHACEADVD